MVAYGFFVGMQMSGQIRWVHATEDK